MKRLKFFIAMISMLMLLSIHVISQTQLSIVAPPTTNVTLPNNPTTCAYQTCSPNGWHGNVPMQSGDYIQFDLGSTFLVTQITCVVNRTSNTTFNGFQIQGSFDGNNCQTISSQSITNTTTNITVNLNYTCRYIRFTGASYGNTPQNYPVYFSNVVIYGISSMSFNNLFITGSVGIGTTNVSSPLTVQGNVSAGSFSTGGAVTTGSLTTTGVISAGSLNTSGAISSGSLTTTGNITTTGAINAGSLTTTGNVGIGVPSSQLYKLAVNGSLGIQGQITAEKVVVQQSAWGDYVFNNNYKLKTITETEAYIKLNKHLEDVPSETEVKEKGIDLGEMNSILLKKIEEMTLQLIEQNKKIEKMSSELEELKNKR